MSGLTPTGFVPLTTTGVQTKIEQDELSSIDPALNLSPVQPLGQLNGIFASSASLVWQLVQSIYSAIDPSTAIGVQLDNVCALTGVTRNAASKTLVTCSVNLTGGTTVAIGQLLANIAGSPQYTFTNIAAQNALVSGNYTMAFQATQTGPIVCNAGTLTAITSPVGGWNSITNAAAGTTGANVETDTALRLRRSSSLVIVGGSTVDSIRAAILAVPNVIQAVVLENVNDITDANSTPAHAIQCTVWDNALASTAAIGQAIWNAKPAGIRTSGSTGANPVDATGKLQFVGFTRVVGLPIYFAVTVQTNANTFPINGAAMIQAAMVAEGLQQIPGVGNSFQSGFPTVGFANVIVDQYKAAIITAVPGIVKFTAFALDTVPAPTATADLILDPFHIATVATANVAVTVT